MILDLGKILVHEIEYVHFMKTKELEKEQIGHFKMTALRQKVRRATIGNGLAHIRWLIFAVVSSVETGSYVEQASLKFAVLHLNLLVAGVVDMPYFWRFLLLCLLTG